MPRPEKTVFISYRRKDISWALAVYHYLTKHDYDVFFDYKSIPSGDFEQIIIGNIKARAHFLVILTPTALDRTDEPGDWLRREIETAISERRNIIPLFFDGFNFGAQAISKKLTGKLGQLKRYNGLDVPAGYFDEAMERLRDRYLDVTLDAVLHPVSEEVQKAVKEQQVAANEAIESKERLGERVRKEKGVQEKKETGESAQTAAKEAGYKPEIQPASLPANRGKNLPRHLEVSKHSRKFTLKPFGVIGLAILALIGLFFAGSYIEQYLYISKLPVPTPIDRSVSEKDGMEMVYVPAGEFKMGVEMPFGSIKTPTVHTVKLDAYWIDRTEVTTALYAKCVEAGICEIPEDKFGSFYGSSEFENYPMNYVNWYDANTYCEWAGRRLPTEAEWEKAASWNENTQKKNIYPWGDEFNCMLTNCGSCAKSAETVGSYERGQSFYGVYDMSGNVWEWVADWYDAYPGQDVNASSFFGQVYRVERGGAPVWQESTCRSDIRGGHPPDDKYDDTGFRCAMDALE